MKKIWQLDCKDKAIHRHMSFAANQLRKVARLIREYKSDSPEWQKHASEADKASKTIETWLKAIREEEEQTSLEVEAEETSQHTDEQIDWYEEHGQNIWK